MQTIEVPHLGGFGLLDRLAGFFGSDSNYANHKAQSHVQSILADYLDDGFVLLSNHKLPNLDVQIPFVLVGPPGLSVIFPSAVRGVYRARGDTWLAMNEGRRKFEAESRNLVRLTRMLAQAVNKYLNEQGLDLSVVDPALVFTSPYVHVDTSRPSVRIVIPDGLEKYAADLANATPQFDEEQIQGIISLLKVPVKKVGPVVKVAATPNFLASITTGQWLILGALLLFIVGVLIVALVYLLLALL